MIPQLPALGCLPGKLVSSLDGWGAASVKFSSFGRITRYSYKAGRSESPVRLWEGGVLSRSSAIQKLATNGVRGRHPTAPCGGTSAGGTWRAPTSGCRGIRSLGGSRLLRNAHKPSRQMAIRPCRAKECLKWRFDACVSGRLHQGTICHTVLVTEHRKVPEGVFGAADPYGHESLP